MNYSPKLFGLYQGSEDSSLKGQSVNIFSSVGHAQLRHCSTKTAIDKTEVREWYGSVPIKHYSAATGQMWPWVWDS